MCGGGGSVAARSCFVVGGSPCGRFTVCVGSLASVSGDQVFGGGFGFCPAVSHFDLILVLLQKGFVFFLGIQYL